MNTVQTAQKDNKANKYTVLSLLTNALYEEGPVGRERAIEYVYDWFGWRCPWFTDGVDLNEIIQFLIDKVEGLPPKGDTEQEGGNK